MPAITRIHDKDDVLVLLCLHFISNTNAGQPYAPLAIPERSGFADVGAFKGKSATSHQQADHWAAATGDPPLPEAGPPQAAFLLENGYRPVQSGAAPP